MPTDADFLAAIAAHPADDTPRLVYADWLEERGDADRAAYLRAVAEVVQGCREGRPDDAEAARLRSLTPGLPAEWVEAFGGRFSVVLYGFPQDRKINLIKAIREAVRVGLAEAKHLSESVPVQLVAGAVYEQAYRVWSHVRGEPTATVRLEANGDPPALSGLRFRLRSYLSYFPPRDDTDVGPDEDRSEAVYRDFLAAAAPGASDPAAEATVERPTVLATGLAAAETPARLAHYRGLIPVERLPRGAYIYIASEPETDPY